MIHRKSRLLTAATVMATVAGGLSIGVVSSLIGALSKIHNWNALGMRGGRTMDINNRTSIIDGVDNYIWVAKLNGKNFDLVPGADPICGKAISGVTVSPPNR